MKKLTHADAGDTSKTRALFICSRSVCFSHYPFQFQPFSLSFVLMIINLSNLPACTHTLQQALIFSNLNLLMCVGNQRGIDQQQHSLASRKVRHCCSMFVIRFMVAVMVLLLLSHKLIHRQTIHH